LLAPRSALPGLVVARLFPMLVVGGLVSKFVCC